MNEIVRDLHIALRSIRSHWGFAAAVVLTFALGIGATTALFSFVDALLLRQLPFADADRVVQVQPQRGGERGTISALEVRDIGEQATLLEGIASFRGSQYIVAGEGTPENARAAMTSWNLFDVLGVKPYLGTTWPQSHDGTRVFAVVLSYDLWRRRFGSDRSIIGKPVTLDSYSYTVLGVLPAGFDFPGEVGIYRRLPGQDLENRSVRTAGAVAKLKRGVTIVQAQRELDAISGRLAKAYPETNRDVRFVATPLRDYWIGDARPYLAMLTAAVACVLLIACANVAALLLARSVGRDREVALRVALGAGRARIVRLLLIETLTLALAGGVAGLMMAQVGARMLDAYVQSQRPAWMAVQLDGHVLVFAICCTVLIGLAAGIVPALRASSAVPHDVLKEGGRSSSNGPRVAMLRHLVAAQIALAVVLVTAAGLAVRGLSSVREASLGFNTERLLALKIDPPWSNYDRIGKTAPYYARVLETLRQLPSVEAAATDDAPPVVGIGPRKGPHKNLPVVEGEDAAARERTPFVNLHMVSPRYFGAMRIPILRGRAIEAHDVNPWAPVAVVGDHLASLLWPDRDPIGRRLQLGPLDANYNLRLEATDTVPRWVTVVGVAADVKEAVATEAASVDLYVSNQQFFTPETYVLIRTHDAPSTALQEVRNAIWSVDPGIAVFDVNTMTQRIDDSVWQRRLTGALSGSFAALALLLATVGLYGVLSFMTAQRRGEIGVRAALGADDNRIMRMVLGDAARMVAVGFGVGLVAALLVATLGADFFYTSGVFDLIPLAFSGVILSGAAFLAACIPARRAAAIDPATVMRDQS